VATAQSDALGCRFLDISGRIKSALYNSRYRRPEPCHRQPASQGGPLPCPFPKSLWTFRFGRTWCLASCLSPSRSGGGPGRGCSWILH